MFILIEEYYEDSINIGLYDDITKLLKAVDNKLPFKRYDPYMRIEFWKNSDCKIFKIYNENDRESLDIWLKKCKL